MRSTLRKMLHPIWTRVSSQVEKEFEADSRNLARARQRFARDDTAKFIEEHLSDCSSVARDLDVIKVAAEKVDAQADELILEFGVYQGRTVNLIASLFPRSTVYGFDSFEGLPQDWRDGFERGKFAVPALPKVASNVSLVKGWFDQTLPHFLESHTSSVAFLHVDCDLYSSTSTVLSALGPRMRAGTVIVFDEYFNYPGWRAGEHKAFIEFLAKHPFDYDAITYNRNHEQLAIVLK